MALRSGGYTKRAEIPHERGEWMELKLLGWRDLDQARRARQSESYANLREMGEDLYTMMQRSRSTLGAAANAIQEDPLQQYNLGTVLSLGIKAWSYDAPVTEETIGQLDTVTAEWAARAIIGVVTESPEDRKNDSAPSTSA